MKKLEKSRNMRCLPKLTRASLTYIITWGRGRRPIFLSMPGAGCTQYFKEKDYKKLTWLSEATSDASLEREEVSILPISKTILDLGNNLDFLERSLGKVIKRYVALARLEGIEPRKLCQSIRVYLPLNKENKEPYHVSPPIGCHLEHSQVTVIEDVPETWM